MSSQVTTATKVTTRTVHPFHPAATFVGSDSGTIVSVATAGKVQAKLVNGAQTGGTKEGEVFTDFA